MGAELNILSVITSVYSGEFDNTRCTHSIQCDQAVHTETHESNQVLLFVGLRVCTDSLYTLDHTVHAALLGASVITLSTPTRV
ncbi:MAG: hypothetical protein QOJ99_3511, partial [Bryobacterales bacterium]|nr:hypothetical protein [Bryobacterales bacterium]